MDRPRVAIACQGGGSHTAFTAGALSRLLAAPRTFDVVGISGTSGGAMCALMSWNGLVGGREDPTDTLRAFWEETAASSPWDLAANAAAVTTLRFLGHWFTPESSPYESPAAYLPNPLLALLERHGETDALAARVGDPGNPLLLIGAVNVRSGAFVAFRGGGPLPGPGHDWHPVTVDAVLASAAVPSLFKAVEIDGEPYWDGLYSQNPPLRELLDAAPDELWIIRINPDEKPELPVLPDAIRNRRNELSGNLPLQQELFFIEKVNRLLADGMLSEAGMRKYRHVAVRQFGMTESLAHSLDYESKLDRSSAFLDRLFADGEARAEAFLADRAAVVGA